MAGYDKGLDPRQPQDLKIPEYTSLVRFCLSTFAVHYGLIISSFHSNDNRCTYIYFLFCLVLFLFVYQLTAKIENVKIGILKEGFGLKNSEADVDKMVREAAEQLGSKCGAVVEEVSIPMHSDGNCHGLNNYVLQFII